MTVVLHHARRDEELHQTIGLSALFAIEAVTNGLDQYTHFRYGVVATTSVCLGVYCVWVIGSRFWRMRRFQSTATAPLPATPDPSPSS